MVYVGIRFKKKYQGIVRKALMLTISFILLVSCNKYKGNESISGISINEILSNSDSEVSRLKFIDSTINSFLKRWEIKGAQLAIVRNDSLVYAKGYGFADEESGEEMTPGTIMRIASVSKLVTAVAIMRLVDEGRLSLSSRVFGDDGILNYIDFSEAINDNAYFDITVEHLLRHTGGFSVKGGDPMFLTRDIMLKYHLDSPPDSHTLVRLLLGKRLKSPPGQIQSYSNFGYLLLSMIIEKISGMDYEDYVCDEILAPAGILDFHIAGNYESDRYERESKYYLVSNAEMVEEYNNSGQMVSRCYGGNDIRGLKGAGAWVASASEVALLASSINGNPIRKDILSESSIKAMTHTENEKDFGLGWHTITPQGEWIRTGSLSCTGAVVKRFPDGEIWVMITNTGSYRGPKFPHIMKDMLTTMKDRTKELLPQRDLFSLRFNK